MANGSISMTARGLRPPVHAVAAARVWLVELHEVVGGRDQAPFRAGGRPASSVKPAHPPVVLVWPNSDSTSVSVFVEPLAALGRKHSAHPLAAAALPAGPDALSHAGVGRDQHLDAAGGDSVHLLVVPVAGVGDDDLR